MSFLERMKAAAAETVQPVDPWRLRLERVRGTTGFDGLERISTQTLLDILGVEQRKRTAGMYRHLATLMAEGLDYGSRAPFTRRGSAARWSGRPSQSTAAVPQTTVKR